MSDLTIVMYHYVRDLKNSRYPEIKGLDTALFKEQIAYLSKHYNFVTAFDVMDSLRTGEALPPRATLLTFDDAYMDHFTDVFPVLDKAGISGCFFPPVKCITENLILDVNKIHFILASVADKQKLVTHVNQSVSQYSEAFALKSVDEYWSELAKPNRYDTAEVIYIKRMLQRDLPEKLRNILTDELFTKFVSSDQTAFSRELYMSPEQIAHMQNNGMYIGSHGFDHYWLNSLSKEKQAEEIDLSLEFLKSIGSDTDNWVMCYPYGGYNADTLDLLRDRNCRFGLTTHVGIANLESDDPLELPRLDTNDLPKNANAEPNDWTRKIA